MFQSGMVNSMNAMATVGVLITSFLLVSCVDFAENNDKYKSIHLNKHTQSHGQVYTMRGGLGGIFSKGMNHLEDTLENKYRIGASSTVWYKASALSRSIINDYKAKKITGPIILVGHSLGANDQIKVAWKLAHANIPVALLITVDAVSPIRVPPNVVHVYNIYTPSFIPLFSGLTVKAFDPSRTHVDNVNVDTIKNVKVNHFTIDANKEIQAMMVEQILAARRIPY